MRANRHTIGDVVGRLTIIGETQDGNHKKVFICRCECGNTTNVFETDLGKKTFSCGCYAREKLLQAVTKHGGRYDRLYLVWKSIKTRCYNPHSNSYQYYGAIGVGMCDEWRNDYPAFKQWSSINGYDSTAKRGQCTLDRIDRTKGYSPDNCRWVSMAEQNKNKRRWGEAKREQEHIAG